MTAEGVVARALSRVERDFIDYVEAEARLATTDRARTRFSVAVTSADDVVVERRCIEILTPADADDPIERVCHTTKRAESGQARYELIETRFELSGRGIPDVTTCQAVVEAAVRRWLRDQHVGQRASGDRRPRPGRRQASDRLPAAESPRRDRTSAYQGFTASRRDSAIRRLAGFGIVR